ncbi:HAD family hydrolase [Rubinisphaera italica]|uniref:phosphoglycolate phosphatase n=1 Tax=Rubinisphaera italica TaxID=2527969 RepID=A0A5C5XLI5_9PLAN|nr:HAD hydrolase-like protein [Rubinisphaera italica]TWT63409.1 Phosphoglycolate phosphatase [Rubinisphaera italica]
MTVTFSKTKDYLVGVDSDGCAFDSMEIKHKECFIPNFIKYFGLQPVSRFARETAEFTNLYSTSRGANRFVSYLMAIDMLKDRPEVEARNVELPQLHGLRDWMSRESKLGTKTIKPESEKTGDADLKLCYEWSAKVDETVADMVTGVPPFPGVKSALEKMKEKADVIVCSATPTGALETEWAEHDISQYVAEICGQEAGNKTEILTASKALGYEPDKMLMIGDAPGDMKAALAVGACFYPINPGHEEASWERFNNEALDKFFAGEFRGAYMDKVIAEFETYLPEQPPWKK